MTVLLVDDDPDIRLIVAAALERLAGHRVLTAVDVEDALEVLGRETPDLVLCDRCLPDRPGEDLLEHEAVRGSIPLVFLTARAGPADVEALTQRGALGVIEKPFDPEQLPVRLRHMMEVAAYGTEGETR